MSSLAKARATLPIALVVGAALVAGCTAKAAAPASQLARPPMTAKVPTTEASTNADGAEGLATMAPPVLNLPLRAPQHYRGILGTVPSPCLIQARVPDKTLGFAFDSAVVSRPGARALSAFVHRVLANDARLLSIAVNGYTSTDAPGRAEYDYHLSSHRAANVAALLKKMPGLTHVKIRAIPHGENDPVASNRSAAGRVANRRTELDFHFAGCA
jgi:outer membrane protein OmpA-like peptidoglycan-associated protein